MSEDPQGAGERRLAARHLLTHPLLCEEHDPEIFRLVRRHEVELDRWFTQRLGYRLHVGSDTARLGKSGYLPVDRPLRASSGRPLHHLELTLLVLVLGSTAAGPPVISLRDLVDLVRLAAAEAGISLAGDGSERRGLVAALRWMIDQGLATELHAHVEAYIADEAADAVLKMRPDRIAMLPLPPIAGETAAEMLALADRRAVTRQWVRARLVEDPVVYRDDLDDAEWLEIRRRLGDEERFLDEMFGLRLEARAEGVAAIDTGGGLADRPFPASGTAGHAALLLIDALSADRQRWWALADVQAVVAEMVGQHRRHWSKDLADAPDRLTERAVDLLVEVRLAQRRAAPEEVRLLPAAARFAVEATSAAQTSLW